MILQKQAAAVAFVEHMTSDEIMSTFVTTEVTALKTVHLRKA